MICEQLGIFCEIDWMELVHVVTLILVAALVLDRWEAHRRRVWEAKRADRQLIRSLEGSEPIRDIGRGGGRKAEIAAKVFGWSIYGLIVAMFLIVLAAAVGLRP